MWCGCPGAVTWSPTWPGRCAPATSASRSGRATSPPCPTRSWPPGATPRDPPRRGHGRPGRRRVTAVDEAAALLGPLARRDVALGPLTTYRVGGPAALAVTPRDEDELLCAAAAVQRSGVPVLVVGRGSNLLVADAGFPGLAVLVGDAFGAIELEGTLVRAGGGASLPVIARRTAAAGLAGLEWAV